MLEDFPKDGTMDLDTPVDAAVMFTGKNGTDDDKEHANKYLTPGNIYFVSRVEVYDWLTNVWLEGFEHPFNSVQFENV